MIRCLPALAQVASARSRGFRVSDAALDPQSANGAAAIVRATGLSVADAHLGALARAYEQEAVVVLTSDPHDVVRAAAPAVVRTIRI